MQRKRLYQEGWPIYAVRNGAIGTCSLWWERLPWAKSACRRTRLPSTAAWRREGVGSRAPALPAHLPPTAWCSTTKPRPTPCCGTVGHRQSGRGAASPSTRSAGSRSTRSARCGKRTSATFSPSRGSSGIPEAGTTENKPTRSPRSCRGAASCGLTRRASRCASKRSSSRSGRICTTAASSSTKS